MKILFYLSRFPGWGGIETVTECIGNKLVDLGYEVSILSHIRQDRPSLLMDRIKYYLMPDEGKWNTENNLEFGKKVSIENHFDAIIYQDSYAPTEQIAFQMKIFGGGRLVVNEHSIPTFKIKSRQATPRASFLKELYRNLYYWPYQIRAQAKRHLTLLKQSDAYVVLAKGYIDDLCKVCGRNTAGKYISKIHYINNPIIQKNSVFESTEKQNIILFVGQLKREKGIYFMMDIWKQISDLYPDWKFVVVGDGPEKESLKQSVIDRKIERVELCGFQNPDKYYKEAKVFWMASAYEGWPMTLLEAMQYACIPIAIDNFSSLNDIIDNGINGFIIDASDSESFVEKTNVLINNDALRNRFGEQAIKKASLFDINRIGMRWDSLLKEIVQK